MTSSQSIVTVEYVELAAGPAEVRAHLDALIVQQPELFEHMALREMRRLGPRLHEADALGIAYDAILAVIGVAARTPVALGTVLGLVRTYVRWAALDRLRQGAPGRELAVDPHDLQAHHFLTSNGSLMEDLRVASHLRTLDRIGARMRAMAPSALRAGTLRLSTEHLRVLSSSMADEPLCAVDRKRLERARAAIVAWVRTELVGAEERLLALLLGDGLPDRERRRREPELVRVLGLDRVLVESAIGPHRLKQTAGMPILGAAGRDRTNRTPGRPGSAPSADHL